MNLSDIITRAEFHDELRKRLGTVTPGQRRPRLSDTLQGACKVLDTAVMMNQPETAVAILRATARAFHEYAQPVKSAGLLSFLSAEIATELGLKWPGPLPARVNWATRLMETLHAGLGDDGFYSFIQAVEASLDELKNPTLESLASRLTTG